MGRITKPNRITEFLKVVEVDELNERINSDELIHGIMKSFHYLNQLQKDFLYHYIKNKRFPNPNYKPLGVKGAYWDKEEDMEIPEYKWEDLSDAEKEFYGKGE